MNYGILTEDQLKTVAEGRLNRLFEIWHHEVSVKTGKRADIVLGNRRDSISPVRGGILTSAVIEIKGEDIRLKIWYDPLELYYEERINEIGYNGGVISEITEMLREDRDPGMAYDPVSNPDKLDINSIAVQAGRWLLKFRGFLKLGNENRQYFELESFLNSECCIPALYTLFDESDFSCSGTENKRLIEVYEGLRNMDEPERRVDIALNALRISNIFEFSGDSDTRTGLKELLEAKFARILNAVNEIDQLKSEFNITEPDGLSAFMKKLVLKYRMPGSWVSVNETEGLF